MDKVRTSLSRRRLFGETLLDATALGIVYLAAASFVASLIGVAVH